MVHILKHIFVYFGVSLIVATTGGIGIVQHHCGCSEDQVTFATTGSASAALQQPERCCASENTEDFSICCSSTRTGSDPDDRHGCNHNHDCCSFTYSYFKTDLVNLVEPVKKTFRFQTANRVRLAAIEFVSYDGNTPLPELDFHGPPDIFGKSLLIRIHQLKTSHLFC